MLRRPGKRLLRIFEGAYNPTNQAVSSILETLLTEWQGNFWFTLAPPVAIKRVDAPPTQSMSLHTRPLSCSPMQLAISTPPKTCTLIRRAENGGFHMR